MNSSPSRRVRLTVSRPEELFLERDEFSLLILTVSRLLTHAPTANVSWDDVAWIKERAPGVPVIVKGVATVDDVELALKAGASGVVLSNHGARQLDYAVSTTWIDRSHTDLSLDRVACSSS